MKLQTMFARVSANRGTAVHHMCEDYLNNFPIDLLDKWKEHEKKFLPYCLFKQLKKTVLEKIDNIRSQECLCSLVNIELLVVSIVLQSMMVNYLS